MRNDVSADEGLPCAWPVTPLSDLAAGDSVTYGVVQPGPHTTGGIPMLRVNNFRGFGLYTADVLHIAPEVESKHGRTRLQADDVLLTIVGSVGQVAIVPSELSGWNIARAVALVRPKVSTMARWIALYLRSPNAQHALGVAANTTVQTTINLKELKKLPVPLPSDKEREEIVTTLSALDEKVALLREINATLEAIAQAIFKSWFVDFDPVRAKMEGHEPEGMDAETAALFPDSFEDSELGKIPKGWTVGTIGSLAKQHKGSINPQQNPETLYEHFSLPAFDSQHMPVLELGAEIKSHKTSVPPDSVLLSKLNPHIPRIWLPVGVGSHAVCSTEFLVFVPAGGASKEFIYCTFKTRKFSELLCQLVTGTSNSHQRVKAEGVSNMSTVLPPREVLEAFAHLVKPLFERAGHNVSKAQVFATLRDILLPRLMSGRLTATTPNQ